MIKFEKIHLIFGRVPVIEDLSLNIKAKEKVVLFGRSGSGKSSLFSMLLGFVKPDKGRILFNGKVLDDETVWQVRREAVYVDQDISLGNTTASELIDSVSKLKANSHLVFSKDKIHGLLEDFGLSPSVLDKHLPTLSGGERQRIAIIITLLLERKVFLLDEVTSSLDEHLKKKVVDYFANRDDITCLISSHDPQWYNNDSIKVFNVEEKRWEQ